MVRVAANSIALAAVAATCLSLTSAAQAQGFTAGALSDIRHNRLSPDWEHQNQ